MRAFRIVDRLAIAKAQSLRVRGLVRAPTETLGKTEDSEDSICPDERVRQRGGRPKYRLAGAQVREQTGT
jgi:hypothetical protein